MKINILFVIVILSTILSCKKKDNLNIQVKGTVIDITNNKAVNGMYINLIESRGEWNYSVVNSAITDNNGRFELDYKIEDTYTPVSIAVNESPDPSHRTPVLSQYTYCFPCFGCGIEYLYAGDNENITINTTRFTTLTVSATTTNPLTGNDYLYADIPGIATDCNQFPVTSYNVPAKEEQTIYWNVQRSGIVNSYKQTIICQADTINYFTINY